MVGIPAGGSRASGGLESRPIQSARERRMYKTARRTLAECVMFVSSSPVPHSYPRRCSLFPSLYPATTTKGMTVSPKHVTKASDWLDRAISDFIWLPTPFLLSVPRGVDWLRGGCGRFGYQHPIEVHREPVHVPRVRLVLFGSARLFERSMCCD